MICWRTDEYVTYYFSYERCRVEQPPEHPLPLPCTKAYIEKGYPIEETEGECPSDLQRVKYLPPSAFCDSHLILLFALVVAQMLGILVVIVGK